MDYDEFREKRRKGLIRAGIDTSDALRVGKYLPDSYHYITSACFIIFLLSIPTAFAIMYFYSWWVGLLSLFIATPCLYSYVRTLAIKFVLQHVDKDKEYFDELVRLDLLLFIETED